MPSQAFVQAFSHALFHTLQTTSALSDAARSISTDETSQKDTTKIQNRSKYWRLFIKDTKQIFTQWGLRFDNWRWYSKKSIDLLT